MSDILNDKAVTSPEFWRQRLLHHRGDIRRALWSEPDTIWDQMEEDHRINLQQVVRPHWSILDCGCGAGRLLELMPDGWHGNYLGVDISPELIALARKTHPQRRFLCADLSGLRRFLQMADEGLIGRLCKFDLAVCVMLRHMLATHVGKSYWQQVSAEIQSVSRRMLVLEPREVSHEDQRGLSPE
jgi:SAM-dependent methyltransferase